MTPSRSSAPGASETLTARQQAIVPIAAFAAAGGMAGLDVALNRGLDASLTISGAKEVLVQLYAYAGFPRSLNALGELMKVLDAHRQRGIQTRVARAGAEPVRAPQPFNTTGVASSPPGYEDLPLAARLTGPAMRSASTISENAGDGWRRLG